MHILDTIKSATIALKTNKIRTALTVLGMVIGIASVIIVFSAGEGINSLIVGEIESFGGSDMFEVEIKVPSSKSGTAGEQQSAAAIAQGVQPTSLTLEDYEDILKLPNVVDGYAGIIGQEQVSYGSEMKLAMVLGQTSSYIEIDKSEVEHGRWFTAAEDRSLASVVVLGKEIKYDLFGDSDPIGKSIKVRKSKFRVIGVLEERGAMMTFDFDKIVYIPIRTLQKRVMGINHVQYQMFKVADVSQIDDTAEEARFILRDNHDLPHPEGPSQGIFDTGKDDFRVVTMVESMEIMGTVTGAITLLLLAIVAISLVVGGVGIMNIMYVVVSERTAEIGLRKAVGAKYRDIMWQFLIESVLITIFGGIIGTSIGVAISWLVSFGASAYGLNWEFVVPIKAYIVALGFSGIFGLAFGVYPARKAARLEPVEALRAE
ncbi:ABC transporter permease [Candidatus Parcubacteria bacterium]|nr:ABC transporter permease [Candidatus Parcubacteria bacterium]